VVDRLRIALAQLNPKVGALAANLDLAKGALNDAVAAKADILMLSELFLTGYFPEDLFFKPRFVEDAMQAAGELVRATKGTNVSLLLPTMWREGHTLYNAVLLAEDGKVTARRLKRELPNDDVFYEKRYFTAGPLPEPVTIKGVTIGVPICEDIWHRPVCEYLVDRGAELLLCPNGSPYWKDKQHTRKELVRARVQEDGVPLLYLNQVGGQDELVFDGASFGMEPGNRLVFQGKSFESDFIVSDWERGKSGWHCTKGDVVDLASTEEAQKRLQQGGAGPVGRHRQRHRRGDCRRCAGPGECPLHHAALSLHQRGEPARRQGLRRATRRALRHRADRQSGG
jgi:NAD+ synthase